MDPPLPLLAGAGVDAVEFISPIFLDMTPYFWRHYIRAASMYFWSVSLVYQLSKVNTT